MTDLPRRLHVFAGLFLAGLLACTAAVAAPKHLAPVPQDALALMQASDVAQNAPILVRAFKREGEMEVWKQARNGRYILVKTFPICRWSGQLGPKRLKGDRQTPEGFYAITANQMNPNSAYYLAFDTGFPNAVDKANKASGSALMVHGNCSSSGCYAMTDQGIGEIYALAREALGGGQWAFQFQSLPFRMTADNMVRYRADLTNVSFWVQLKEGYDRFEATKVEPTVAMSGKRYTYVAYADRKVEQAALDRINAEQRRVADLLAVGTSAVRLTYVDGGQHPSMTARIRAGAPLGEVSRPEALATAGLETVVPGTNVKVAVRLPPPRVLQPDVPVINGLPPAVLAALAGARVPVAGAPETAQVPQQAALGPDGLPAPVGALVPAPGPLQAQGINAVLSSIVQSPIPAAQGALASVEPAKEPEMPKPEPVAPPVRRF